MWYKKVPNFAANISMKMADTTRILRQTKSSVFLFLVNRTIKAALILLFDTLPHFPVIRNRGKTTTLSASAIQLIKDCLDEIKDVMPRLRPTGSERGANTSFPLLQPLPLSKWQAQEFQILREQWALLVAGKHNNHDVFYAKTQDALEEWRQKQALPGIRPVRSIASIHAARAKLGLMTRFTTVTNLTNAEIDFHGRTHAAATIVGQECTMIVQKGQGSSLEKLSNILVTRMADKYSGFELSYFDAYLSVFSRVRKHPSKSKKESDADNAKDTEDVENTDTATDAEQQSDNTPEDASKGFVKDPPTMDEYNRWIPILMDAPHADSVITLAKLIYEDDPTRWTSPEHAREFVYFLALHGKSVVDPKKTRNKNQVRLDMRMDVIASMTYRRDYICTRNVDSLDFLPLASGKRYKHTGSWLLPEDWTPNETAVLVDGIVTAYTDPAAIAKYEPQAWTTRRTTAYIGTLPQPQVVDTIRKMMLEKWPNGYFYGSPRDTKDIQAKVRHTIPSDLRDTLNKKFHGIIEREPCKEKRKDLVSSTFKELVTAYNDKLNEANRQKREAKQATNAKKAEENSESGAAEVVAKQAVGKKKGKAVQK